MDFNADDEDEYCSEEVTESVFMSDDQFCTYVFKYHNMNYHNSRDFFNNNTDLKYGKIDVNEVKKNILGIKKLLNHYLIRMK